MVKATNLQRVRSTVLYVEFYNNSSSTNFTVTGAGITASGTPYVLDEDF